jgi:hypothetical protein
MPAQKLSPFGPHISSIEAIFPVNLFEKAGEVVQTADRCALSILPDCGVLTDGANRIARSTLVKETRRL